MADREWERVSATYRILIVSVVMKGYFSMEILYSLTSRENVWRTSSKSKNKSSGEHCWLRRPRIPWRKR